ncbi:hypothetical protein CZ787_15735 [Halomonas citrativorans]|uniref:Uncharacterized protein n=1 Tax=Halomonas citrativorans TaxID=2742612 RepID=A0A1R4I4B4_9GAMM|nr:hypothetical protein CZ787_15735 [Halomonas citrativorans]
MWEEGTLSTLSPWNDLFFYSVEGEGLNQRVIYTILVLANK